MTKDQLLELEIERRALLATVEGLTRGTDARMETEFDEFLCTLEDKAAALQKIIDENLDKVDG